MKGRKKKKILKNRHEKKKQAAIILPKNIDKIQENPMLKIILKHKNRGEGILVSIYSPCIIQSLLIPIDDRSGWWCEGETKKTRPKMLFFLYFLRQQKYPSLVKSLCVLRVKQTYVLSGLGFQLHMSSCRVMRPAHRPMPGCRGRRTRNEEGDRDRRRQRERER